MLVEIQMKEIRYLHSSNEMFAGAGMESVGTQSTWLIRSGARVTDNEELHNL